MGGNYISDDNAIYSRGSDLPTTVPRRICIIGVGGVGSWVAIDLAMMGCETLVILDPDTIEVHNLNRTLFKMHHVGEYKVNALYDIIREMRSTKVIPLACKWEDLDKADRQKYASDYMVVDCRDTITPLPENPRTLITGGYDGTRCTIHYNPDFSNIFGDGDVRYRVTPSYLVIPQFIAACITNFICLERPVADNSPRASTTHEERFITFDFAKLSDMLVYGNHVMESERAADALGERDDQ